MGLLERISGWLQRRKEALHRQRIYRASAYFGSLLKHGEADAVAVRRCVEDYKDFPEMTKRQVELLLEHGSLYSIRQAGHPEWQAVIETLAGTCYGRQTLDGTRHSVAEEAENPLSLLFARYEVLREGYENRRYKPLLPTSEIQARRNEAHRLLNYRMRERPRRSEGSCIEREKARGFGHPTSRSGNGLPGTRRPATPVEGRAHR